MPLKSIILTFILTIPVLSTAAQSLSGLKEQLQDIIRSRQAQTGIAVIINGKDTVVINNEEKYPMMSVFKFHQALTIAAEIEKRNLELTSTVYIKKNDLKPDTYSPLRNRFPDGNVSLSLKTLLEYTLQLSDNNACDILFKNIAGTKETDCFIRSLGIRNFAITATEDEMHTNPDKCYDNWTTPLEAAILIEKFLTSDFISAKNKNFIYSTMTGCKTGLNRLAKPIINKNITLGHKTGSGDRNTNGEIIATNDIGFFILPNGFRYTIAVFVKDSKETGYDTEKIIGDVSETVFRFISDNYQE